MIDRLEIRAIRLDEFIKERPLTHTFGDRVNRRPRNRGVSGAESPRARFGSSGTIVRRIASRGCCRSAVIEQFKPTRDLGVWFVIRDISRAFGVRPRRNEETAKRRREERRRQRSIPFGRRWKTHAIPQTQKAAPSESTRAKIEPTLNARILNDAIG